MRISEACFALRLASILGLYKPHFFLLLCLSSHFLFSPIHRIKSGTLWGPDAVPEGDPTAISHTLTFEIFSPLRPQCDLRHVHNTLHDGISLFWSYWSTEYVDFKLPINVSLFREVAWTWSRWRLAKGDSVFVRIVGMACCTVDFVLLRL